MSAVLKDIYLFISMIYFAHVYCELWSARTARSCWPSLFKGFNWNRSEQLLCITLQEPLPANSASINRLELISNYTDPSTIIIGIRSVSLDLLGQRFVGRLLNWIWKNRILSVLLQCWNITTFITHWKILLL